MPRGSGRATRKGPGGADYIHGILRGDGGPAVTIHAYSPRLDCVGRYRLDHDGIMRVRSNGTGAS